MRRARAFSLIEVMVVLVLIGLLAGLVTVSVRYYLSSGKQKAAAAQISSVATALETFYSAHGRYPDNDEGLVVLTRKSEQIEQPLLRQVPVDPWGYEFVYNMPGPGDEPYEVISLGADHREGGDGENADIVSWKLATKRK